MKKSERTIELDALKWTVTRVNGKIASVSPGYKGTKGIVDQIVEKKMADIVSITTELLSMDELDRLSRSLTLDDLMLIGTQFQTEVWSSLFEVSHDNLEPRILSYSEFAQKCGKLRGLRAVAHAIGLNPIAFIIPCHRIVPKACIREIEATYRKEADTIFRGADIYVFNSFDFGEYGLGKQLKRDLLAYEFTGEMH